MENKRVASAARLAVGQRNYRRARDRALARLAQAYPNQYKELIEEERERDELEGKKWTSITDSPYYGVDYTPQGKRSASATTTREGGNASNDEGKA